MNAKTLLQGMECFYFSSQVYIIEVIDFTLMADKVVWSKRNSTSSFVHYVTLLNQAIKTNREVINYHWQLSEFLNVISWVTVQLVSNVVPGLSIILEKKTKVKPNQRKQDFSGTQDDTQFYYEE